MRAAVIFGINPVLEQLRHAPAEVSEIFVLSGRHASAQAVIDHAYRLAIPVRRAERALLKQLSGTEKHQGVVARVAGHNYLGLDDLLQEVSATPASMEILAVDGVTDPRNLGALLRTAEAAGVRHILIPEHRAVGITPTVAKSSAGAVNYLRIFRVTNLHRALVLLKKANFWVAGLDTKGEPIYGRGYPDRLVILVGSEGSGIRPLIRRECDLLLGLPMRGKLESLNVAVAAGVFLYELLRQKCYPGETTQP